MPALLTTNIHAAVLAFGILHHGLDLPDVAQDRRRDNRALPRRRLQPGRGCLAKPLRMGSACASAAGDP
jgi:hypothetical protein